MGHYCRICGCIKPNEKFSGKGHNSNICKECSKLPKEVKETVIQEEEIFNFLNQSNISKKNIKRLRQLVFSENEKIVELAKLVLEIALVKPHKKRRLKYLSQNRKDLLWSLIVNSA